MAKRSRKQPLWVWILLLGLGVVVYLATTHGFNAPILGSSCSGSQMLRKEGFVAPPQTKACPDGSRSNGPCLMDFP